MRRIACSTATSSILPTPVFFYGHGAGAGNQRRHRARQDAHRALRRHERAARGWHAHRVLRAERPAALGAVPDRSQVAKRPPQRKAEPGNPKHVGAPMPGTVATVTVTVGQKVARGDVLADARSDEDGNRGARGDRRRSRRSAGRAPGSRSMRRICWSFSNDESGALIEFQVPAELRGCFPTRVCLVGAQLTARYNCYCF